MQFNVNYVVNEQDFERWSSHWAHQA